MPTCLHYFQGMLFPFWFHAIKTEERDSESNHRKEGPGAEDTLPIDHPPVYFMIIFFLAVFSFVSPDRPSTCLLYEIFFWLYFLLFLMIDHLPVYFMDIFSVCILFLDVLLLLLAVHFLDRTALPLSKLLDFCSHSKMMLCWQRYKIFLNMPMHLNCHTVLLLTTDIVCHFMNVLWHWEINKCFSNMIKAIFVRSFSCSVCVCVCVCFSHKFR